MFPRMTGLMDPSIYVRDDELLDHHVPLRAPRDDVPELT